MTKEEAEIIYKDVIQRFGFVDNPSSVEAVYILRNGKFLDTCGGYPNHQHINIANYISQAYKIDDVDKLSNGSKFMTAACGAVRITC